MALNPAPIGRTQEAEDAGPLDRLLSGVSRTTVAALSMIARTSPFTARDVLVGQGDALPVMVVLDGWAAVRRTSPEGRVATLHLVRPGQVLGIESVARSRRSPFDLVALTAGRIATMPGTAVRRLAKEDPTLAVRLLDLAIGELGLIARRLDEATFDGARKRLATVLLVYEPLVTAPSPFISRADLAGLVGTSREMLGHVIRAMEAEGVIAREGRRIVVRDQVALEREAGHAQATGTVRATVSPVAPRPAVDR